MGSSLSQAQLLEYQLSFHCFDSLLLLCQLFWTLPCFLSSADMAWNWCLGEYLNIFPWGIHSPPALMGFACLHKISYPRKLLLFLSLYMFTYHFMKMKTKEAWYEGLLVLLAINLTKILLMVLVCWWYWKFQVNTMIFLINSIFSKVFPQFLIIFQGNWSLLYCQWHIFHISPYRNFFSTFSQSFLPSTVLYPFTGFVSSSGYPYWNWKSSQSLDKEHSTYYILPISLNCHVSPTKVLDLVSH
jgi:hypothetical protein